jgi:hypothetical protein
MRAPAVAVVVCVALVAGGRAAAGPPTVVLTPPAATLLPPGVVVAPLSPLPVVTGCRVEPRLFYSLRTGWIDYCRGHLGYEPGALDCFNFSEQVCTVFLPATQTWTESRYDPGEPVVFPCPDAAEPPTCPRLGP